LYLLLGGNIEEICKMAEDWQEAILACIKYSYGRLTSSVAMRSALESIIQTYEQVTEGINLPVMTPAYEVYYNLMIQRLDRVLEAALKIDPWLSAHILAVLEKDGPMGEYFETSEEAEKYFLFYAYTIYETRGESPKAFFYSDVCAEGRILEMYLLHCRKVHLKGSIKRMRSQWLVSHRYGVTPVPEIDQLAQFLEKQGREGMAVRYLTECNDLRSTEVHRICEATLRNFVRGTRVELLEQFNGLMSRGQSPLLDLIQGYIEFTRKYADPAQRSSAGRSLVTLLGFKRLPLYLLAELLVGTLEFLRST
jgi:hypothetical protein